LVDPDLRPSINLSAVDQYLSLLYIPAPASIFSEVKKLPAGHYLLCTERGLEVHEYWDVPLPPEGEEDRLDEESLRAQLREAVRRFLRRADVGGIGPGEGAREGGAVRRRRRRALRRLPSSRDGKVGARPPTLRARGDLDDGPGRRGPAGGAQGAQRAHAPGRST